MKTEWPTKKLGEVLKYEQPQKYIVSSTEYSDEYKIPVLTPGKSFIRGYTNEKNDVFPAKKLPVIIFDDFTTASKFVDFPFKVKSSAMKILHADKDKADIKYLFYLMQTIKINHDTHKRYWISEYSKIEIPLPSVGEQKKIVAKLEKLLTKVKEAKRLRDEVIKATQNLLSAELHKIFEQGKSKGLEEKELWDVCDKVKTQHPKNLFQRQFRYISISEINPQEKKIKEWIIYPVDKAPSRARRPVKSGDVIFALTRPYLKNIAMVEEKFDGAVVSTGFCVLRAKTDILSPKFLFYFVTSENFLNKVLPLQRGASYPAITESDIFSQKMLLPPFAEQKKIVEHLDMLSEKIKKLQEYQKTTQSDLDQLEKSILHKAFEGELVR